MSLWSFSSCQLTEYLHVDLELAEPLVFLQMGPWPIAKKKHSPNNVYLNDAKLLQILLVEMFTVDCPSFLTMSLFGKGWKYKQSIDAFSNLGLIKLFWGKQYNSASSTTVKYHIFFSILRILKPDNLRHA